MFRYVLPMAGLLPALAFAVDFSWTEPHLLRREALVEGRPYEYNSQAFVKRFGYRHLFEHPTTSEDGVRGTGGSVTSDRLFLDMQLAMTFPFDGERQEFFFSMERTEDFDGAYDRQIIGLAHHPSERLRLAVMGDVPAGKGDTDIYLEARWLGDAETDEPLVRLVVAFSDVLHDKRGHGEYRDRPITYFGHVRHRTPGWHGEVAVNRAPRATLVEPGEGRISADQTRAMIRGGIDGGRWWGGARWEGVRTARDYTFESPDMPPCDTFRRRADGITLSAGTDMHHWEPEVGVRYFRLREHGWSGTARAVRYRESRDEWVGYLRAHAAIGARQHFTPTVYLAHVDIDQQVERGIGRVRDESGWQLTVALPWSYLVDAERGGVLTVNPTIDLHRGWFGGGNVQLHWPL
jgi:hypothetical protein